MFFFPGDRSPTSFVIVSIIAGIMGGGSSALLAVPAAATVYLVIMLGASVFALMRADEPVFYLVTLQLISYGYVLIRSAITQGNVFAERFSAQMGSEQQSKLISELLAKAEHSARHDTLTGMPNRRLFLDRLSDVSKDGDVAVMLLDLDRFKAINDERGHHAGDDLLRQVAARIFLTLGDEGLAARLGGDEFAIIHTHVRGEGEAAALARQLIETFKPAFVIDGVETQCHVSIGVAVAPRDFNGDELMKNADFALYRAKRKNGSSYRLFRLAMAEEWRWRNQLERDLPHGLERDEMVLAYQPILNLQRGRLSGFEALPRWRHPRLGMLGPEAFVGIAEESGLIHALGAWTLREACREAARWPDGLHIAVNLSPLQFRNADLAEQASQALAASGLEPARLEVEIPETVLLSPSAAVRDAIERLRAMNVSVVLDHFGAGLSSLGSLRNLKIDKIKIDRSFTSQLLTDHGCGSIIKALIGLARDLDMRIAAEGVETDEQSQALAILGCAQAQGHLIGKPLLADEVVQFIAQPAELLGVAA